MGKELFAAGQSIGNLQNGTEEKLGISNLLHIQDRKDPSATGGTATLGAYRTRDLNTVLHNGISGASLAANRITLPIGTYFIEASAVAVNVDSHNVRLQKVSGTAGTLIHGTANRSNAGSGIYTSGVAMLKGLVTIDEVVELELQHSVQTTAATTGY